MPPMMGSAISQIDFRLSWFGKRVFKAKIQGSNLQSANISVSRVEAKFRSGQRSSVNCRLTREGAR